MHENASQTLRLSDIAKLIDHSLLHPTLTDAEIKSGCRLARSLGVATACVKPYSISLAKEILAGSEVGICPVIAFPHGNSSISIKAQEAVEAVEAGGQEIDMVINIGKALSGDWGYVSDEIRAINEAVTQGGALLKTIFENDYLEDSHIIRLCEICSEHRVAFIKTSSGFGFVKQPSGQFSYRGATDHHLQLMRRHAAPEVRIKAAGGLRSLDDILRARALGADRIGASATQAILEEARQRGYC